MAALCLTPACIIAASNIIQNLAPNYQSIDPCDDFDQYVCGGFPTRFPDKKNLGVLEIAIARNHDLVHLLLDGDYPASSEASPDGKAIFAKLQNNYLACMDTASIQAEGDRGAKAIFDHVAELLPAPDLNATLSIHDYESMADLQVFLNTLGVDLFMGYRTSADTGFSPVTLPTVAPLSAGSYIPLAGMNATQLTEYLALYLPTALQPSAEELLGSVLLLEGSLFSLPLVVADAKSLLPNETAALAPSLSIDKVLGALVPLEYEVEQILLVPNVTATISTIVDETPKAVILAFALLKAFQGIAFASTISETDPDRWNSYCKDIIDQSMPWAASKFFVESFYNEDTATAVVAIVEDIRAAFLERIDEAEWMTDATRAIAKEKAGNIQSNVIYPKELPDAINATALLAFYDGFEVGTSYFNNSISYLKWHSQRSWNQLLESQLEWPTEDISYTVNAAYAPTRNQIYITAGISQAPFFDPSLPEYLNYGQLGYTSGHELTHGFDNTGHNYDQTGLLKKTWDNETEASFLNLTQCFVDQVDGFDLHVDYPTAGAPAVDAKTNQTLYANGTMSLGENIADNGGIVTSFAAWSKRKDRDVNNLKLPGLDQFTIEQLFFVAAGQFWCHNTDLDSLATNVATDVHAPAEARIRTIAENSRGFRDAFNCKKKEPVCELW